MVAGLAFIATAIATLFAQATAVRWSRTKAPHQAAWTFALALFALASAALATGASTGWDEGTFRAFYLLGAVLNVPWLALGTVYLLLGRRPSATACAPCCSCSPASRLGVMLAAPIHGAIAPTAASRSARTTSARCPRARRRRQRRRRDRRVRRRGVVGGARSPRRRRPGSGCARRRQRADRARHARAVERRLLQGIVGHDEAFALTLAVGIAVIYARASSSRPGVRGISAATTASARRTQLARERPRQLVDQLDARRQLVAREPAARVPQQLDRIGSATRRSATTYATTVSPVRGCGSPTTATSATSGCCASTCSTSPGIHVEARDDDDVLGALDEREPAVGVGDADVARVQPTVDEHAGRRRRIVASSPRRRWVRARGSRRDRLRARRGRRRRRAAPRHPAAAARPNRRAARARPRRRDDRRRLGEPVTVVHRRRRTALRIARRASRVERAPRPTRTAARARTRRPARPSRRARATLRGSRAPRRRR